MKPRAPRPISGPRHGRAPLPVRRPLALLAASLFMLTGAAQAQDDDEAARPAAEPPAPVVKSALDAPLFYQLLVGEMEAQAGRTANAYEVMLDAARRTRDAALFQRAMELALQSRNGDRALQAARAWRQTLPESGDALRAVVQLLAALNKPDELAAPLQQLIRQAPEADRSGLIASVPRFLSAMPDKAKAHTAAEQALAPFVNTEATRTASRVALGRLAWAAGQGPQALALARRATADDPAAIGPVLLAIELMGETPDAEALVLSQLQRPGSAAGLRMAYARALEQQQRLAEAVEQMRLSLAVEPTQTQAWLALGSHLVDLRQPREALTALARFQEQLTDTASPARPETEADSEGEGEGDARPNLQQRAADLATTLRAQAWLQLGDLTAAQAELARIAADRTDLSVAQQRAELLRRQGQLEQARTLLREAPLQGKADERLRLMAEASLLREAGQWQTAYDLLLAGVRGAPDDSALIYELAMVAERLERFDDMEVLLRRVMILKPDDAHAYNALGYTLAERGIRLDEARELVARALSLAPRDAFIIDSLGWIEFRQGRLAEALRLLRQSWRQRPHAEVAAHLGEVLWVSGQPQEARAIWRDGLAREADNSVLQQTLKRLKVSP